MNDRAVFFQRREVSRSVGRSWLRVRSTAAVGLSSATFSFASIASADPAPQAVEAPPAAQVPASAPTAEPAPPPAAATPSAPLPPVDAGPPAGVSRAPVADPRREQPRCDPCESNDDGSEGYGGLFVGAGLFDFSSLNDRLNAHGYEELGQPMPLLGGEGHAVFRSGFVVGARGGAILGPDGRGPDGLTTSFGGGFGMLDLGFALVHRPSLLVTLTGGVGGYGLSLGISDGQSARFDDVLENPRRSSSLGHGGLLVGLGFGLDGRVPVGNVERGRQGFFTLGMRIGALYGPPLGDWGLSEGGDATSGPSSGLTGGYAALVIGFGGSPPERR